jgi:hypothetical protein
MQMREVSPRKRRSGGVYPYLTKQGTRWYFKARGSDGAQITRRGFTNEKAARDAKRRLTEQLERGEIRHTREPFSEHWHRMAYPAQTLPGAGNLDGQPRSDNHTINPGRYQMPVEPNPVGPAS